MVLDYVNHLQKVMQQVQVKLFVLSMVFYLTINSPSLGNTVCIVVVCKLVEQCMY